MVRAQFTEGARENERRCVCACLSDPDLYNLQWLYTAQTLGRNTSLSENLAVIRAVDRWRRNTAVRVCRIVRWFDVQAWETEEPAVEWSGFWRMGADPAVPEASVRGFQRRWRGRRRRRWRRLSRGWCWCWGDRAVAIRHTALAPVTVAAGSRSAVSHSGHHSGGVRLDVARYRGSVE